MICVFAWHAVVGVGQVDGAQGQDVFVQIASESNLISNELVTPQPPSLPERVIRFEAHDPEAVFEPANKLDTPEELETALRAAREKFAPFLTSRAPTLAQTRRIQSIDSFDWRIAEPADWQDFSGALAGAREWERVNLPHYGEPLGRTNTFYRTSFRLDAWQTNEAVFVRFRGVDYKAHVFVNAAYAGSHEGFFAPFEFDITRLVRPGENVLFVNVENDFPTLGVVNDPRYPDRMGDKLYAATGPGFDDPIAGWHHCPPGMGIYQPVTIEVRPRVFVHDIFVRPLPERDSAEAVIEVWNCDTEPRDIELQYAVHGLNFETNAIAWTRIENADPAGGGVNFYRVQIPMADYRRWTLAEPWLYEIQVRVNCAALGTTDAARRSFGMRSFVFDTSSEPKGRFILNGKEILLRGANTMGFEQQDVMRGEMDRLRDDLLLAKIANLNFLRITQRPVQEEVYDMADRLGLMIQTDFPLFGHMRPNQFAEGVRQGIEMERLIRSHPSCVLVSYINERFSDQKSQGKIHRRMGRDDMNRFFTAMDQAVLSQNPDRVIKAVDGDYDSPAPGLPDNHCYTLWYFRNGIDIGLLHEGFWQPVKPGWNYACGEFGSEGLDRIELMRRHCPPEWLPGAGESESEWTPARIPRAQTAEMHLHFFDTPDSVEGWIRASREHQAWATRLMTEAFRRDNRMKSFAIHLMIDAWPTGWMKAIVDFERQPKPAYFACQDALTPLMANIRAERWKFFSNERMRHEFWICNDTHAIPSQSRLAWQLEVNGKVVHAQRTRAEVRPVEAVFQGFTDIPVPRVTERTPAVLRLALFDGEKLVHDTHVELEFFPEAASIQVPVQVIGKTDGPAAGLVRDLDLPTGSNAAVLLIDDYAAYQARRESIDSRIQNGARAIFLNLAPGEYLLPGAVEKTVVNAANPHFLTRETGHVLVKGFQPFDFRFWFDAKSGMITPLANGKFSGGPWRPIVQAQGENAAAERASGSGRVVLCQVFLADRVRFNPPALEFARRLLTAR